MPRCDSAHYGGCCTVHGNRFAQDPSRVCSLANPPRIPEEFQRRGDVLLINVTGQIRTRMSSCGIIRLTETRRKIRGTDDWDYTQRYQSLAPGRPEDTFEDYGRLVSSCVHNRSKNNCIWCNMCAREGHNGRGQGFSNLWNCRQYCPDRRCLFCSLNTRDPRISAAALADLVRIHGEECRDMCVRCRSRHMRHGGTKWLLI